MNTPRAQLGRLVSIQLREALESASVCGCDAGRERRLVTTSGSAADRRAGSPKGAKLT
jgi:hypothetical protein